MTKLNTHIPSKYIKRSEKLRKIWIDKYDLPKLLPLERKYNEKLYENSSFTIADIIDNAEKLFGVEMTFNEYSQENLEFEYAVKTIIDMCFRDDSIDEISKYIIKNIKED